MRPASARFVSLRNVTFYVSASALLVAALTPAFAAGKKDKTSRHSPNAQDPVLLSAHTLQRTAPPPATTDTWTGSGSNADWSNASNWNNGAIATGDNILINLTTAATTDDASFTIGTLTLSNAGDSVTVNPGVTLTVGGAISNAGTITNDGGLIAQSTITNTGTIAVNNNTTMTVDGNISNNGTITLNSGGSGTGLQLGGNVTLSGTGTLTLSNNSQNYIYGATSTDQLTNQETIQGAGQIGHGSMALVNSGTINANQSAGMTIDVNDGLTNTGTIEATSGATLLLYGSDAINTGGTISANASTLQIQGSTINGGNVTLTGASSLQLNNSTVVGVTLTNSSTGTIETTGGTSVLGGTINNSAGGIIAVSNNTALELEGGTYSQLGTVQLNSSGSGTYLVLDGNVTLSGGSVTLSNNSQNYISGQYYTDTLTNAETISGAGQIGHGSMTLVNSGTINSNQSSGITIQANGGLTNTGTIEATSGSTLLLYASGSINNTGGTISANTGTIQLTDSGINGGNVTLTGASTLQLNSSTINNGTLTNSSTGTIETTGGTSVLGGTINNSAGGIIAVSNNTALELEGGTYSQLGTVQLNSSGSGTYLVLNGNVTLTGGSVTLSNNSQNYIQGTVATDTLTNEETISGAGQIGHGSMALVNSGTINSNQSGGMTIQANGGLTNTGTIEATNGSTLLLYASGSINNAGGTITANTGTIQLTDSNISGGNVTLTGASTLQLNTATINGGTLTNSSTGLIETTGGTSVLGGTINNSAGGIIAVSNNTALELQAGTYSQLGTVQLNSSGSGTYLVLNGNVTLTGGSVTLSNNSQNYISGASSSDILNNQETISGAGQIGHGSMTLINSGTINANQSAGMTIQASGGIVNTGTIEVTNGATLGLYSSGVIYNAGGTIAANTGIIQLTSSTINGGAITLTGASSLQLNNANIHGASTITNSSTGLITTTGGTSVLGGTINNSAGGIIAISNNTTLALDNGTYSQLGAVQLNSAGSGTGLEILGNVTLSGGTVTMSGNSQNYIYGSQAFNVLTNAETIQGAGQIGNGQMGLVNSGSIVANAAGNIVINVSYMNFNNTGTIEANGANLTIEGPGVTFFTNDNQSTNTLTGGTYIAQGSNIEWNAGAAGITTLAANVTETGGGQIINTYNNTNVNMLAGLTGITSAGSLSIGGVTFADAGAFSNAGSLTILSGENFSVGSLTQISSGSLTAGTYVLDGNLNITGTAQTITTNATTLTLAGGTIENTSNSTNALAGLATNTGKLTIAGSSNNVSTTASSFSNTGTLTINSSDSFSAAKLTQISGTTLSGGTFVLSGNLDLTTTGISVTTNSSTLTLSGGTINSGSANALGALATNTKSLTIAGTSNNVSTSATSFSNTGTLTINAGDSFTAAKLTQVSGTTLSGGTYVLAGNLDLTGGGAITTNSATLTLEGGTFQTGSTNDLANLASNTKSLTLSNNASFTTGASFNNSGTLTVSKGSMFTTSGSSGYTQSAGTTTVDGTLAGGAGGISVTGGTLAGAGTLAGNVSNNATINVGDSGKAGLLAITGTYSQLSSGKLNVGIGGTTLGTQYSQIQITGTASLGGTLTAALISSFTPKVGSTFTILTASSVSGTFTNSTIAINSTEEFQVSYTSNSVVLTVVSIASNSNTSEKPAQAAVMASNQPIHNNTSLRATAGNAKNSLLHLIDNRINKRVLVSGLYKTTPVAIAPISRRIWENIPATPSWDRLQTVTRTERPAHLGVENSEIAHRVGNWSGTGDKLPARAPITKWTNIGNTHRVPLHIALPVLPVR